jgi:large subunit ribosomal protein L23
MNLYDVLRRPITTEKTDMLQEQRNAYVFEVAAGAHKAEITRAVETLFEVRVLDVRTMNVPGKRRRWGRHRSRTPSWKKAVVTLAPGHRLELFE